MIVNSPIVWLAPSWAGPGATRHDDRTLTVTRSAAEDVALVRIELLGPTAVTNLRTGESMRSSAARTLLGYLAATGTPATPNSLAAVLWPDRAPATPVAAIRNIAWRARRVAGPAVITTDPDGSYRLNRELCAIDAAEFRDLLTRGRSLQAVDRPAEALTALTDAIALWRGPALSEWARRRWAAPLVAEWGELLLGAREERAALRFDTGDLERAEVELEDICTGHPDREHAWSLLVGILDSAGRPNDARRAFDRARRHLARSGLEPGAELRAALDRLGRAGRRIGVHSVDLGSRQLVGRTAESAAIQGAIIDSVTTKRSKLVLIEGEAGIGKTLLSRAVVAEAQADRRLLAWFTACESQRTLPYAPLVTLLRALRPAPESRADPTLSIGWLQGRPGAELSHWQIRERFTAVLSRAAERIEAEALVLVVDDIQWAPTLTLEVLTYLLGQPGGIPVVVLATHRTHGDEDNSAALDDMQRRVWVEKITLGGLQRDASIQVYLDVGGHADRADDVWRLTGGNPFYLQELGRVGPAVVATGERTAASAVLDRALSARVLELPEPARRVLTLAATVGPQFDEVLLRASTAHAAKAGIAVDPTHVVDAVLDAIRAGLVVPAEHAKDRWQFRHDLVRQNLYYRVSGRERAQAHLCVARAMEQLADHRVLPVDQVAHHLTEAWPLSSAADAATRLLEAAETPVALLDPRASAELCSRALDVLARDPDGPADLHRRLLVARGTALADAGEPDDARAALQAAIRMLDASDDAPGDADEIVAAYVETWRDRTLPAEPARLLASTAHDDRLGLSASRCQAVAMLHAVDAVEAGALTRRLAAQARQAGDVAGEHALLVATWRWQDAAARRESADVLAELGRVSGSPDVAVDADVRQAITTAQLGSALYVPANDVTLGDAARDPRTAGEALTLIWAITVHTATGAFDRARDIIVRLAPHIPDIATLTASRPARIATMLLRQSIQLGTLTGLAADTALLAGVLDVAEIPVDVESGAIATLIRARRGDMAGARAACADLVEQADPVLMPDRVAEHASLALACVETDFLPGVERSAPRLLPFAEQHIVRGEHLYLGPVRYRLAALERHRGRFHEAGEMFARSAQQSAAVGAVPWQVRSLQAGAEAHRAGGDLGAAELMTAEAEALSAAAGMTFRHRVGELLPADAQAAARTTS